MFEVFAGRNKRCRQGQATAKHRADSQASHQTLRIAEGAKNLAPKEEEWDLKIRNCGRARLLYGKGKSEAEKEKLRLARE